MKPYTVQKATIADLPTIHNMAQVAFRYTYREMLSKEQIDYMMDWMYSMPNLEKQLQEGHEYYIAMQNDTPCGYLSVQYEGVGESGKEQYHLQKIYLLPTEQGNGLGRILFQKALEHVRKAAAGKQAVMRLNVNRDNTKAVAFYQHMGMEIVFRGDFHIGQGFYMTDYIMEMPV